MSAELAGKAYVEMSVKGREDFAKAFSDMQSSVQTFAARLNAVRAAPNGTAMQKFFKSAKKEFGDLIGIAKQYGAVIGVARQEYHTHGIVAFRRQADVQAGCLSTKKRIGQLQQHAGAIARQWIGAHCAAVSKIF